MKNLILNTLIVLIIAGIGYGFWYIYKVNNGDFDNRNLFFTEDNETFERADIDEKISQEVSNDFSKAKRAGDRYVNEKYGFSFIKPSGYNVGFFPHSSETEIVLLQNDKKEVGAQIALSYFDETGPLTAQRIRQELPDLPMDAVTTIKVAGTEGVSFLSRTDAFGNSSEIWFIRNNLLFQMTTYESQTVLLAELAETLEF